MLPTLSSRLTYGFWAVCFFLFIQLKFGGVSELKAADWPQWRGEERNGLSAEQSWSDRWPDTGPLILWKAQVGAGFSSFTVSNGQVFTMGNADNTDTVFALEAATGKTLWKHSYSSDLGDKYFEGGTTGTPTVSGDRVYTLSRWGDVFCFERISGQVVWTRNVQRDTGARLPSWGFAGSPLVLGTRVFLNVGEAGLALEKSTGKTVWQSSTGEAGYTTPLPWSYGTGTQVLIGSGRGYVGVDVITGKELWRIKWLTQYGVNAADPVIAEGRLFLSSGYGKGSVLIQPGTGAEPEITWKSKVLRTQMNAAVHLMGYLYGVDGDTTDKPVLKCVELASGTEKWANPDLGCRAMMMAGGRMILMGEKGELSIAPASPDGFKPTARAQVLGGKCWTVPVLANGLLYCRNSRGDVACLDLRLSAAK